MQFAVAICRPRKMHKKNERPKVTERKIFFLDPKTDEMEFITTQEATKFLGRKQPLKKKTLCTQGRSHLSHF